MFKKQSLLPIVCAVLTVALFLSFHWPSTKQFAPQGLDIAKRLMNPPAKKSTRYNFSTIDNDNPAANQKPLLGQWGQLGMVADLFKGKKDGFFMECGALDGEQLSNSLLFEIQFGWQGLLIEAIPEAYENLKNKHRRAYSINAALSRKAYPTVVDFEVMMVPSISGMIEEDGTSRRQKGGFFQNDNNWPRSHLITLKALPLFSILSAIGNPTVDYFSLDIEGSEEGVLETLPWNQVDIRVLQVEYVHSNTTNILRIMEAAGYANPFNLKEDLIFVKRGFNMPGVP